MAPHRKSNAPLAAPRDMSAARRRNAQSHPTDHGIPPGTRELDASSALEKPSFEPRAKMTVSRAIAMAGIAAHSALPAIISWGLTMSLIFGGCCSNVFALEAIVKDEPQSGLLITFTQFLLTTLFTMNPYLSMSRPQALFLKPRAVPLTRWIPTTLMFFTVNMMNNFAFGYKISVPVHIILRSGGSVTTMLVGFFWGKRYSSKQIVGVAMLTVGVMIAAMADAQSKGKMSSSSNLSADDTAASFATGLAILFFAQLISAIMGIYVQDTYSEYGPHWQENLFYSHILSLPLFAPFFPAIRVQFARLIASTPITLAFPGPDLAPFSASHRDASMSETLASVFSSKTSPMFSLSIPSHVFMLLLNSLTQFACIRGVNLLGARTSALGVTIVLNVRKLVSLFISIWLFGNKLPAGVMIGALVVFSGAAVYSWSGSKAAQKPTTNNTNGKAKVV